jgi:hypothetical protein
MYTLYEKEILEFIDLKTIFLTLVGKKPSCGRNIVFKSTRARNLSLPLNEPTLSYTRF